MDNMIQHEYCFLVNVKSHSPTGCMDTLGDAAFSFFSSSLARKAECVRAAGARWTEECSRECRTPGDPPQGGSRSAAHRRREADHSAVATVQERSARKPVSLAISSPRQAKSAPRSQQFPQHGAVAAVLVLAITAERKIGLMRQRGQHIEFTAAIRRANLFGISARMRSMPGRQPRRAPEPVQRSATGSGTRRHNNRAAQSQL